MKERAYDKTRWGIGPWLDEPDRVSWKTGAGLPGLIVRNPLGALCGYAAVPPGHPFHGKDYDDPDVEVHGGLTYAARCEDDGPICHVPDPGEPDNVWWFGFDCAHFQDLTPGLEFSLASIPDLPPLPGLGETYKDIGYVRAEVESLARQLVKLG